MKWYVFINLDYAILVRSKDYIDNDNPLFFQENERMIETVFQIDTENVQSLLPLFSYFKRNNKIFTELMVREFCSSVGLDLSKVKQQLSGQPGT